MVRASLHNQDFFARFQIMDAADAAHQLCKIALLPCKSMENEVMGISGGVSADTLRKACESVITIAGGWERFASVSFSS